MFHFQQLEEELLERQPQVHSLREIASSLLVKASGRDYIEAEEKVHVIDKKLKQLLEQVSQDLVSLQGNLVSSVALAGHSVTVDTTGQHRGGLSMGGGLGRVRS